MNKIVHCLVLYTSSDWYFTETRYDCTATRYDLKHLVELFNDDVRVSVTYDWRCNYSTNIESLSDLLDAPD